MFTSSSTVHGILRRFVRRGSITVTTADGVRGTFGDGTGEQIEVRFLSRAAEIRTLCHPELAIGEAFMDGTFVVNRGTIAGALAVLMGQPDVVPGIGKLQWWARRFFRRDADFRCARIVRRVDHGLAHRLADCHAPWRVDDPGHELRCR